GLGEEAGLDHARRHAVAPGLVAEQALDRDRATDAAIVGFVDDRVPASPERAPELVALEPDPTGELERLEPVEQREPAAAVFGGLAAPLELAGTRRPTPQRAGVIDIEGEHGLELPQRTLDIAALEQVLAEHQVGRDLELDALDPGAGLRDGDR